MKMLEIGAGKIVIVTAILLAIIALITVPFALLDATDVKEYSDTAKFFAGEYAAKVRTTHSMSYGLLLSPFVTVAKSYFLIRFSSAFFLILLILSVYYISEKNKKVLWFMVLSPAVWYAAPWISPVPAVMIAFVWAYYFLKKFDKEERWNYVIYAGILLGIGTMLWPTVLYFSIIFLVSFLYDKRAYYSVIFLAGVAIGLIPQLVMDQIIFGFAAFSMVKFFFALAAFALYGGAYQQGFSAGPLRIILVLLFLPVYSYLLANKKDFLANKKLMIFLMISLVFILTNPQIRLLILVYPFIALLLPQKMSEKQFKIQMVIFVVLSLLMITPYVLQSRYDISDRYLEGILLNAGNFEIKRGEPFGVLAQRDMIDIAKDYPDERFVVGNANDDYRVLAHLYWGDGIDEFISIEDYNLYLQNKSDIASKEIRSNAAPAYRREIWIDVGIGKNSNDDTDYRAIEHAISVENNLDLEGFKLAKRYRVLSVYEKD